MPKAKKYIHPDELFVGHKTFKIVQRSLSKEELYGCVEFKENRIIVDPNQSPEDYKATLLHEIFHIGLDMFGLGDDEDIPKSVTNEFLTAVTTNMIVLLSSMNPDLFKFLFNHE